MTASPVRSRPVPSAVTDVTWFFGIAIVLCFAISIPMVLRLVPADVNNLLTPIM